MAQPLTYYHPTSTAEATRLLVELGDDGKAIAGGTALTIMLRQGLVAPRALVSLAGIPGLDSIGVHDGELVMGGLVRHRDVETSPLVRDRLPVVAETFGKVANVRIRNAATVGGVVAESDYASDPPALLVALDATVRAAGPDGTRSIPARDFFLAFYETALETGEIVTAVHVPLLAEGAAAAYEKYVSRSSEDRPCVGVAAVVRRAPDGSCADLRVCVGAAADIPQRRPEIDAGAIGRELGPERIGSIADAYAEAIDPLDDIRGSAWYRREMIRVWVRRAIESALARASEATSV